MPEPTSRGTLPPFESAIGAAAGFVTWLGAASVPMAGGRTAVITADPMFWALAALPIGLGTVGWVTGVRRRSAEERNRTDRASAQRALDDVTTRERLTRSVLQNAFDAVLVLDLAGHVIDANPVAGWVFGRSTQELVNLPIATLLPDHDHLDHANVVERRSADGDRLGVEWRTRARHVDGSLFAVDLHTATLQAERVQVFTLREASSRMRREDRLVREALDAVKDRGVLDQRRRGVVVQGVGTAMRSLVQRQLEALGRPGAPAEAELVDATHGLLLHVEELRNLVMWERSAANPTVGPVELAAVLRDVAADVRPVARWGRNTVLHTVARDIDEIVADPSLLACALRNLVIHALLRVTDGAVGVACVRERGRGTDWVTVFVEDDGPELTPAERDHILSAFEVSEEAVPPADDRAGLALAQRLARALGGHVGVESRAGGTAISLRIPIEPTRVKEVPHRPRLRTDPVTGRFRATPRAGDPPLLPASVPRPLPPGTRPAPADG